MKAGDENIVITSYSIHYTKLYDNFNLQVTTALLGDVDLSSAVNNLDILPFVDLLIAGTYQAEADCNQDGAVNNLDIQPFVGLLIGPGQVIPEPASVGLTLILAPILMARAGSRTRR